MKNVCAWCGKDIDSGNGNGASNELVSHGICNGCYSKVSSEQGVDLRDFIEELDVPVLLVDGEGVALEANRKALNQTGKDIEHIRNHDTGDIYECVHASQPGGCGNAMHCNGCTIRNNVQLTYESGTPIESVPAYLNRGNPEDPQRQEFLISTKKVGNIVFLKIIKA